MNLNTVYATHMLEKNYGFDTLKVPCWQIPCLSQPPKVLLQNTVYPMGMCKSYKNTLSTK